MKWLLTASMLLFLQSGIGGFNRIARTNELKEEAREAYLKGNFEQAAGLYQTLLDSFRIQEEPLRLNYANSLYQTDQKEAADDNYRQLAANATDKTIRSAAYQQLGMLATQNQNLADAVTYFKEALKSNPENDGARYNYELARKKLEQQQEEQEQQKEKPEPSEWAKELKKKAESLVHRYRYQEAYQLMQEGLQQDPTVEAFKDFTGRIGTTIQIEEQ